jgi:hypothetical protein
MVYIWTVVFMGAGILGGELVAWLRQFWLARYGPTLSIEDATEQIMAELAEQRRLAEDAMWRLASQCREWSS